MPKRLAPLIEYGVIDRVVRSLLSGKEAQVYLVECGDELRAAKVYKDQAERSFRNRSQYTEGRAVRNTRDRRAMEKRTRHGRERAEENWITAEADAIYKLAAAGVRVPKPHAFIEGVLVMELVAGADGGPAPRIADCDIDGARAEVLFNRVMREVIKMLCADVVHGDLSVFNVLLEPAGPVVIDFPQVVDAASNAHAKKILLRDVANITSHFKRGVPADQLRFGHEMWDLYEKGELRPDTVLTGMFALPDHEVDAEKLLESMRQIEEDEVLAQQYDDLDFDEGSSSEQKEDEFERGAEVVQAGRPGTRVFENPGKPKVPARKETAAAADAEPKRRRRRGGRGRSKAEPTAAPSPPPATAPTDTDANAETTDTPKKSRRRRRRRGRGRGKDKAQTKAGPERKDEVSRKDD